MNDCIHIIAQFLPPRISARYCKTFAVKFFPSSVSIRTLQDVRHFVQWCACLDTTNLRRVEYVMDTYIHAEVTIGWVPSTVTYLMVAGIPWGFSKYACAHYSIPNTVEEVYLADIQPCLLPCSVKKLTLGKNFHGIVHWPSQLEELVILGWDTEHETLDNLPDTIRHITISNQVYIVVTTWPASLVRVWLGMSNDYLHAPIPKGVDYTICRYKNCVRHLNLNSDIY